MNVDPLPMDTPAQKAAQTRFTAPEMAEVKSLARYRGMSVATFLRVLALREVEMDKAARRQQSAMIIPSEIVEVDD